MRDLYRKQEAEKAAELLEIQRTIARCAKETNRRRKEALERKIKAKESEERERSRKLQERKQWVNHSARPWRLGAGSAPIRPVNSEPLLPISAPKYRNVVSANYKKTTSVESVLGWKNSRAYCPRSESRLPSATSNPAVSGMRSRSSPFAIR